MSRLFSYGSFLILVFGALTFDPVFAQSLSSLTPTSTPSLTKIRFYVMQQAVFSHSEALNNTQGGDSGAMFKELKKRSKKSKGHLGRFYIPSALAEEKLYPKQKENLWVINKSGVIGKTKVKDFYIEQSPVSGREDVWFDIDESSIPVSKMSNSFFVSLPDGISLDDSSIKVTVPKVPAGDTQKMIDELENEYAERYPTTPTFTPTPSPTPNIVQKVLGKVGLSYPKTNTVPISSPIPITGIEVGKYEAVDSMSFYGGKAELLTVRAKGSEKYERKDTRHEFICKIGNKYTITPSSGGDCYVYFDYAFHLLEKDYFVKYVQCSGGIDYTIYRVDEDKLEIMGWGGCDTD